MKLWEALRLPATPRVALIGGGGKTTALFQLGREGLELGWAPILTTTTRMLFPEEHRDWLWLSEWPTPFSSPPPGKVPYLYQRPDSSEGRKKVAGLPPAELDRLADLHPEWGLIYEADGSAGRPVKLHGSHEPVVAACTDHTLVILGLSAWGRPLTEETVHRAELLEDLHGLPLELETAQYLIQRMLERARGKAALLLTQAQEGPERRAAHQLARRFSHLTVVASHHSWRERLA